MVSVENKKICVSCEINNLTHIFQMECIQGKEENEIDIVFPIKETVIFDLQKGTTCIEVVNGDEKLLESREITKDINYWRTRGSYEYIENHKYVIQLIAEKFLEQWPEKELPFDLDELTVERLVLMTRYVGFPKNFYISLPLSRETNCVDENFATIDAKLRKIEDVLEILREYEVPTSKTLNRIFYTNPAYCYYVEEVMKMWKVINNLDLYVRFLNSGKVFEVLSYLHDYPCAILFFEDYVREKSVVSLLRRIGNEWRDVRLYAVSYSAMSDSRKVQEQKRWGKRTLFVRAAANYSRPVQTEENEVKDCTVEGFSVIKLRTSNDFLDAAEGLHNCLEGYDTYSDSAVFVIKKGTKYRAAIQIRNGEIITALGYENSEIEYDEEIYRIYLLWKIKWGLSESRLMYDPMYDEELPF